MGSCSGPEIIHDVPPYIRVYKDGTVERLVATETAPPGFDPQTGVTSKDVLINPTTGLTARLYRPNLPATNNQRLPLVIYFHGGAFCIATAAEPKYHNIVNILVAEAKVIGISVNYRLVPEHPLPAAYEDSWEVIKWAVAGSDEWIRDDVDFGKLFLAGDSAGANISHHMAIRIGKSNPPEIGIQLKGILMIHPYFWGEKPVGIEIKDPFRKSMVDNWWKFVCPSNKGCDDPLINPFVNGLNCLENLACDRIIIFVAENDILSERGRIYYESLVNVRHWKGKAEIVETQGEDHIFHVFNPTTEKARHLIKRSALFLNQD
ncbi:hypothetical protein M9H77_25017 [Catharanthus roseus]|uniref:Uncharacterized protein n=1 Tax=Catharanthus roseus TaxID=4058 RepID=A0ACC0A6J8_CATRO|nr:hypothetical protein M9H77_25017 [Catharanthus roseus]